MSDTYTVKLDRVPFPGEPPVEQTRHVGDGMAAGVPPEDEPVWGNFTGPRVPVPPTTEPWYDVRVNGRTTAHRHSPACLTAAIGGPRATTGGTTEVPEPGWYLCSSRPSLYVHDHAGSYVSHMSGEWEGGCPAPDELPW